MIVICPHCHNDVQLTLLNDKVVCAEVQEPGKVTQQDKQIRLVATRNELSDKQIRPADLLKQSANSTMYGSGSDPDQISESHTGKFAYSLEFLTFWAIFPKKRNKGDAWKAWKAAKPPTAGLLNALSWQCNSADWLKDNGQFVPYPAKYLRARGWEDERAEPKQAAAGGWRSSTGDEM